MSPHIYAVETTVLLGHLQEVMLSLLQHYLQKKTYDGFFLEYDDDRSGDFDPLKYIPNGEGGQQLFWDFVTSKTGELEDKESIKKRVFKKHHNMCHLNRLCLSPQCGFRFNPSRKQINGRMNSGPS